MTTQVLCPFVSGVIGFIVELEEVSCEPVRPRESRFLLGSTGRRRRPLSTQGSGRLGPVFKNARRAGSRQTDGARERLEVKMLLGCGWEGLAEGAAVMKGAPHLGHVPESAASLRVAWRRGPRGGLSREKMIPAASALE